MADKDLEKPGQQEEIPPGSLSTDLPPPPDLAPPDLPPPEIPPPPPVISSPAQPLPANRQSGLRPSARPSPDHPPTVLPSSAQPPPGPSPPSTKSLPGNRPSGLHPPTQTPPGLPPTNPSPTDIPPSEFHHDHEAAKDIIDDIDDLDDDDESSYTSSSEDWDDDDDDEMLHSMAEQAKEDIRRQLRELKAVYRSIKQRNLEIPERFRIQENNLQLPPEIYAHTFEKIEKDCDEVFRVHEYQSAEAIIQLDKLRKFYFDPIETPHIVVKGISHVLQVHTIRNKKSTLEFEDLLAKNTEILEEEKRLLQEQTVAAGGGGMEDLYPVKRVYAEELIGEYKDSMDTFDVETVHNIRHLEKRLAQKYERECAWYELMSKKIPADYIPPEDIEVLSQAKTNTGAYHLQTSESYIGEQISTAERRQRILNIKIGMREEVRNFNKLVLEAREEKPLVLQECRRLEREIRKVHVLLPEEYRRKIPPIYDMEPDETPEGQFDITPEQVDAEEQNLLAAAGLQNITEDIMEDFYGVKKPEIDPLDEDRTRTKERSGTFVPPPAARAARQAKMVDIEFESVASNRCRKVQFNATSEPGKKKFEVQFYPRLYRQEMLFTELNRVIGYFYERIKYLHDLRVKIEIETRVKTIGLLSAISELDIAKEFINQELAVEEVLKVQNMESKNAKKQLEKIKKRLVTVNDEMKISEDKLIALNNEVEITIGTKNRFHDYLWRVFRKKIKLDIEDNKEEGEEQESDDEDEDEEDNEEDEDEVVEPETATTPIIPLLDIHGQELKLGQDNDTMAAAKSALSQTRLNLDVCPERCNRQVYDRIVELRLQRATHQYEMEKNKKLGEMVSAEYVDVENLFTKYQDRATEMAEELRVLQRRGQKKMNDLKLMTILRADQIQCMDMDELAEMDGDMLDKMAQTFPGTGNIVIFPRDGSTKLDTRAADLIKKGRIELEKFKRGKSMLVRLYEEFHKAEKEVSSLKEQVKLEMMQKFGQEVDLDKICASVINLELIRQEMLLEKTKTKHYRARARANQELLEVKYELSKAVEENTKYNRMKTVMLERRRDLEYYISKNEKSFTPTDEMGPKGDAHENLMLPKLTSSFIHATSGGEPTFDYNQLDTDIENAKKLLEKQQDRICDLKRVLTRCRTKSGVPPLIKMAKDFPQPSKICPSDEDCTFTTTAKEIAELNASCPCPPKIPLSCNIPPPVEEKDYRNCDPNFGDYDYYAALRARDMGVNDYAEEEGEGEGEHSEIDMIQGTMNVLRHLTKHSGDFDEDSEFAKLVAEIEAEDNRTHETGEMEEHDEEGEEEVDLEEEEQDEEYDEEMDEDEAEETRPRRSFQEELEERGKGKRASRKSVLLIAKEAKDVTETEIMNRIHRYSADDATSERLESQAQNSEDVKKFLKEGDEADIGRPGRKRRSDPRDLQKALEQEQLAGQEKRLSDARDQHKDQEEQIPRSSK